MVTLINVFEMGPNHVDAFIASWRERANMMATKPGFVDSRLHRALSPEAKFQVVNVAHWASADAMQAATADPEFQWRIAAVTVSAEKPVSSNAALFEVVVEFSGPIP
jgi:heme-degrading monooxygenase HmoA